MFDPLSLQLPDISNVGFDAPSGPTRKLLVPVPDAPNEYVFETDYSSISSFLCCARQGQNKLVWSREAKRDSTATSFGKLFHRCEETRLEHGYVPAMRQRQLELIAAHYQRYPVSPDEYRSAARMVDLTQKYNDLYANDLWPQALHIHEGEKFLERPYKIPLCTLDLNTTVPYDEPVLVASSFESKQLYISRVHVVLTGRIDAIIREGNLNWVVDHKTTSRGGKEYEEAFFLSLQTRGYTWAAHHLGIPVAGLIMNAVICRPITKTGKATEFHRPHYYYDTDSLIEYERSMRAHVEDFFHCLCRGYFPQSARSFISPCAKCDYQQNCQLPLTQRHHDLMSELYRDITWNPIDDQE